MMVVTLGLLRPPSNRRQPATVGFIVLLLQFPPLAAASRPGCLDGRLRDNFHVIAADHARAAIGQLRALRDWAGHGANPSSNTGKHAAKLAFDAGLACRSSKLRLGTLHGLRERGDPALAVHLLNTKEMPLVAVRSPHLFKAPRT